MRNVFVPMRCMLGVALVALLALLAGCTRPQDTSRGQTTDNLNLTQITEAALEQIQAGRDPRDPPPVMDVIIYLDIYQLDVPLGSFSGNEAFWKRINEQCVDVTTYDVLFKNGLRVGQAPIEEWDYFKQIMAEHPTRVIQQTATAGAGQGVELEMKLDIREQTLAWWELDNTLVMRTFDRCDNLLSVGFVPAPRKLGDVRVTICPTIRSTRRQWVVTGRGNEQEVDYVMPERVYDLNLTTDVPPGMFLIVAPSPHAQWHMSFGRAFLVKEAPAEQMEQLLLIVPRPYRLVRDRSSQGR